MEMFSLLARSDVICGEVTVPGGVAGIIQMIVFLIQVVVPLLLIIWGMIDFAKSVVGADEEKTKAGQKIFIKRVIAAIIVFLVVTVTQLIINAVGNVGGEGNAGGDAWNCVHDILTTK